MASEVFKIVHKRSPEYIKDLVNIKDSTYNFRNERTAEGPRVRHQVLSVRGCPDKEQSPKLDQTRSLILISGD